MRFLYWRLVEKLIVAWLFSLKSGIIRDLKEQQKLHSCASLNLLKYIDASDFFFNSVMHFLVNS